MMQDNAPVPGAAGGVDFAHPGVGTEAGAIHAQAEWHTPAILGGEFAGFWREPETIEELYRRGNLAEARIDWKVGQPRVLAGTFVDEPAGYKVVIFDLDQNWMLSDALSSIVIAIGRWVACRSACLLFENPKTQNLKIHKSKNPKPENQKSKNPKPENQKIQKSKNPKTRYTGR